MCRSEPGKDAATGAQWDGEGEGDGEGGQEEEGEGALKPAVGVRLVKGCGMPGP